MWKQILIRTTNDAIFIKIEREGGEITTGTAAADEVPPRIAQSPSGSGAANLNLQLLENARHIADCYGVELTAPIEFWITKRGISETLPYMDAAGFDS